MKCKNCNKYRGSVDLHTGYCGNCRYHAVNSFIKKEDKLIKSIQHIQNKIKKETKRKKKHLLYCEVDELCGKLKELRYVKAYFIDLLSD
jgi:hypothetical protein